MIVTQEVTIATNMAGRGTDIILGGNPEFEAKREMKKLGYSDNAISFATSFVQSDDEEMMAAREILRIQTDIRHHISGSMYSRKIV